ncbi:unnamed protein product [Peronospora destructor]|uniref:Microsomal glutathione S-transferase 1 n=1 Tax=Peronospora destructor TaxID=86335 RepID=A0AAV0T5Q1_9STRA|nr:unnamed protein product [Peronospora destructor]
MVDSNVKIYVVCSSVLYLKFLLTTCVQGSKRFLLGGRPPEDGRINSAVHAGAMIIYTVARCLYTYVYAHAIQPHRAICWILNVVTTLVGVGNAVIAIL